MSENIEDRGHVSDRRKAVIIVAPTAIVATLQVLAVALVVGGLAKGGAALQAAPLSGPHAVEVLLVALGWFVAGCSAAAVLWSLGWLIRNRHYTTVVQQQTLHVLEGAEPLAAMRPSGAAGRATEPDKAQTGIEGDQLELLQRIVSEVMQMNVHMLMSESQRQAKGLRRQEFLAADLLAAFETSLAGHEFAHAETCIRHLETELPDDERIGQMTLRLAETRDRAESQDIEDGTQQVDDLMAVASFAEAQRLADSMLSSYPESKSAQSLVDRVERESTVFLRDQRQRLYSEVQRSAAARRWQQALEAARRLVQAHPNSTEANAVDAMLPTLRDNARIEQVRQLRDSFRDMINRRRYTEAVEIAQEMLKRFPDTRAANDLRGQMSRLRKLAAEEER